MTEPNKSANSSRAFVLATIGLVLCFGLPLYRLARFALGSYLYSHILLIPFISLYLVRLKRSTLPPASPPDRPMAACFLGAGAVVLAGYWAAILSGFARGQEDSLGLTTFSFLLFFYGICSWFFGKPILRALLFPLGFLLFLLPFPGFFTDKVENLLQYGSAAVAIILFKLANTPVFYQDLSFQLRSIVLYVAPECSGIHSSLALLITSLLAGYFFLRSPGKRVILTLAVIPLALLRNGFRIFTLGELCVHIGPEMIDSPIHHRGGPIFFILSLIPFFFLLFFLMKLDRRSHPPKPATPA